MVYIDGRTLKFCAYQLSDGVLRHLFQDSIDQHFVSTPWKMSTIIPVPKMSTPKQLNDLRPVALTSLNCDENPGKDYEIIHIYAIRHFSSEDDLKF